MAIVLTRPSNEYEQIKHDAGEKAVIYGVPMEANYSDFHNHVKEMMNRLNVSLSHEQAENIMWTGLDPAAPTAYKDCLGRISSSGLTLVVETATASDISLMLGWHPRGAEPRTLTLSWHGVTVDRDGKPLQTSITQGENHIIVPRPTVQRTIAVNAEGYTDSVTLAPLPSTPPPQPEFTYSLNARGFAPQSTGRHQISGCACGTDGVGFYQNASGPNTNTTIINGEAGKPITFRWDASWICQGQGIRNYPRELGTIDFGNGTAVDLPELFGVATVTYPYSEDHKVEVKMSPTCIDDGSAHCSNKCTKEGSLGLNVRR